MFLLPLPAVGRVAVRRLGVNRFWSRGYGTADMTKVRGSGGVRGRPRMPCPRATGAAGWVEVAVNPASAPSCQNGHKRRGPSLGRAQSGHGRGRGLRAPRASPAGLGCWGPHSERPSMAPAATSWAPTVSCPYFIIRVVLAVTPENTVPVLFPP